MKNEFLESCCMCDSENTKIKIIERKASGELNFSYNQLAIFCLDCGFSFVNSDLSAITFKNRNEAEKSKMKN